MARCDRLTRHSWPFQKTICNRFVGFCPQRSKVSDHIKQIPSLSNIIIFQQRIYFTFSGKFDAIADGASSPKYLNLIPHLITILNTTIARKLSDLNHLHFILLCHLHLSSKAYFFKICYTSFAIFKSFIGFSRVTFLFYSYIPIIPYLI